MRPGRSEVVMSLLGTLQTLKATGDGMFPPCVDVSFEVQGETLPRDYAPVLKLAVLTALPWLADEPLAGVHAVRAPLTDLGLVLSRRARLQLRVSAERADAVRALSGQRLNLGAATLGIGAATVKPVQPFATLRAAMVVSRFDDEQAFVDDVEMQLEVLGIKGEVICGKPAVVSRGERQSPALAGFAVVVHELSISHSLRLQTVGLGPERMLGCGLFVHHKIIEGLDAYPE